MRYYLFLLCLFSLFSSCKKEEDIDGDSFRVSIIPVNTQSYDEFKITGTLDIRNVSGNVEYGLVVGKTLNPTVENGVKYVIGSVRSTTDFTHQLNGLDTGSVYYVRAYGLGNKVVQYSANQVIGKLSPQIVAVDSALNFGRVFTIATNINLIDSNSTVKVLLNNTPVQLTSFDGLHPSVLYAQVPTQLAPGKYTLTVSINNINLVYKKQLVLLEGTWLQLDDVPIDNGGLIPSADYFVNGDLLYTYRVGSAGISTRVEFSKYNYKTKERITLTPFDNIFRLDKSAVMQEGSNIHFITGEQTAAFQNSTMTKVHRIYNTVTDTWTNADDFPGGERKNAVSMVANNKLYVGMGYLPAVLLVSGNTYYKDFWAYDLATKVWEKVTDFPEATGRIFNASFSIGSKIYIVAGATGDSGLFSTPVSSKETWCYDATSNQWTKKADYPGAGQISFNSFAIGNYGYVGMGESITYNSYFGQNIDGHFYKYDPAGDKWTEISNINQVISNPLSGANSTQGFVGAGGDPSGYSNKTLYVFTPYSY